MWKGIIAAKNVAFLRIIYELNMQKENEIECDRCFDTKKILNPGNGCCRNTYCLDLLNLDSKVCPECINNKENEEIAYDE